MAVPPSDDRTVGTSDPDTSRPQGGASARGRRVLLAALVVVALVSAGAVIWFVAQGRAEVGVSRMRGDAVRTDRQSERDEVMSQTRQFALRMGTFKAEDLDEQGQLPEYRRLVTEVITPKFKASFDRQVVVAEAMAKQVGDSRSAQVFSVGVSTLDADSATALVAGAFTDSFAVGGQDRAQEPVPFRYEVRLEKIEGTWLVDDFTPVLDPDEQGAGAGAGEVPQPSGQPSVSPSGGGTP